MFWCPLVVRAAAGSALFFVCGVNEALCWTNTAGRVVSASVGIREVRVEAGEAGGCNLGVNAAAAGPHVTISFHFLAGVLRRLHRGESTRVLSQPLGLLPGMKKVPKPPCFRVNGAAGTANRLRRGAAPSEERDSAECSSGSFSLRFAPGL